jgi:hypothetical protein
MNVVDDNIVNIPDNIISIPKVKTDKEEAEELKVKILSKLDEVCKVFDESKSKGFLVQFALGEDWSKRTFIQNLTVAKIY